MTLTKERQAPLPEHGRGLGRMRVLHVVSSLQIGGMEQFVLRLAADQQQQGHTVALLGLREGPLADQARSLGLATHVVGPSGRTARMLRISRILAGFSPTVAHAHNPAALTYALWARGFGARRVIMTRHGQGYRWEAPSWQWRGLDAVVAVSDAAAGVLRQQNPAWNAKIRVIRNGVHLDTPARDRNTMRQTLGLGQETIGITVARLDPVKGLSVLVEALGMLRDPSLAMRVLVVGDGPVRADLERLARERLLGAEHVRFLGMRTDIPELLAAADFFVLPSLSEGLPLSVLEAMAQRLPIIATPVGGIPEVIADGEHGLLVPIEDPVALARAMATLTEDPELRHRMGEAAYRRAEGELSFAVMAKQYEALYAGGV